LEVRISFGKASMTLNLWQIIVNWIETDSVIKIELFTTSIGGLVAKILTAKVSSFKESPNLGSVLFLCWYEHCRYRMAVISLISPSRLLGKTLNNKTRKGKHLWKNKKNLPTRPE
jgi:hypothetical protein